MIINAQMNDIKKKNKFIKYTKKKQHFLPKIQTLSFQN